MKVGHTRYKHGCKYPSMSGLHTGFGGGGVELPKILGGWGNARLRGGGIIGSNAICGGRGSGGSKGGRRG